MILSLTTDQLLLALGFKSLKTQVNYRLSSPFQLARPRQPFRPRSQRPSRRVRRLSRKCRPSEPLSSRHWYSHAFGLFRRRQSSGLLSWAQCLRGTVSGVCAADGWPPRGQQTRPLGCVDARTSVPGFASPHSLLSDLHAQGRWAPDNASFVSSCLTAILGWFKPTGALSMFF